MKYDSMTWVVKYIALALQEWNAALIYLTKCLALGTELVNIGYLKVCLVLKWKHSLSI